VGRSAWGNPRGIGKGCVMATNGETGSLLSEDWPEVRSGPLIVGGILIGVGALVAIAGVAISGSHLIQATRAWMKDLETPPDQLARLKWEQAKAAANAGAASWKTHPNAKVRVRRVSAVSR
jgi:hypothetical protein